MMTDTKTYRWDPAEDIKTREDVINMLQVAMEENDPTFLISVIGVVARSEGMSKIARELKLNREGLYDSFSAKGNPSFATVQRVLDVLGYRLSILPKNA